MYTKYLKKFEMLISWTQARLSNRHFIFLSSILVGVSSALAVIVLKTFAHSVYSFAESVNKILNVKHVNVILPIIGILLTAVVIKRVLGGTIEKGTSQLMYAVAKKASILPKKQMYAQIITSSLTVGLGGSAGLESPITITGAAFGSNYAQAYGLSYRDRTLLLACGVAAGIAAAFNAPIAGVLFTIEVLLADVGITAFIPIMISAATGAIVSNIILNENILLSFKQQQSFDYNNIPYYVILGGLAGFISIYHSRVFQRIEHYFERYNVGRYKKALIGSLMLAAIIYVFPSLFGEGYESIKILSQQNPERLLDETIFSGFRNNTWVLLVFVGATTLLKVFATGITLGSGGNGGNFAPSLFVGSYLGFFFSTFINQLGITKPLPVSNFTLVGMAGLLSGLFHAPLTAIFLIAEITGGYNLMIPLMMVSSISFAISKQFENHSMDIKKLAAKGHVFTSNKDKNILTTIEASTIIQTDYESIQPEDNLEKLVALISHSKQVVFPVVNNDQELVGIIYFDAIRDIIFSPFKAKYTLVKEIMKAPSNTINSYDNMERIMKKFDTSHETYLPVIKDGKYYGFISKTVALETYRNQLKTMTIE
ncbi:chloride channel protein [Flavobacterium sp. '19STA2R22 D10 B1']|uniref:chloride channel protein n=1 Tax=Flavobacterium aerium TaxID=3037261 RepID=UPI00278C3A36|nr:chloride channel protein [Flavobacterium sp. '19STA2R22 D10 B1']